MKKSITNRLCFPWSKSFLILIFQLSLLKKLTCKFWSFAYVLCLALKNCWIIQLLSLGKSWNLLVLKHGELLINLSLLRPRYEDTVITMKSGLEKRVLIRLNSFLLIQLLPLFVSFQVLIETLTKAITLHRTLTAPFKQLAPSFPIDWFLMKS